MDDLLTSSREASPPAEIREAMAATGSQQSVQVLAVHAEALRRRLETQQVERENLRFQVQLLQKDANERQPGHFEKMIASLEVENQSRRAVDDEKRALQRQLDELEQLLVEVSKMELKQEAEHHPQEQEEDEDALEELRFESQRLERRLEEAKRYNRELMEDAVAAKPTSAKGIQMTTEPDLTEDPEIDQLLARNEEKLRRLTGEVRDTATAMARQAAARSPPPGHNSSAIDVLTIGAGTDGADVEWHKERSKGSKQ